MVFNGDALKSGVGKVAHGLNEDLLCLPEFLNQVLRFCAHGSPPVAQRYTREALKPIRVSLFNRVNARTRLAL